MMDLASCIWAIEVIAIIFIILFHAVKDIIESYKKRVYPIDSVSEEPSQQEMKETHPLFLLAEEFGLVRNDFYRHVLSIWDKKKRLKLLSVKDSHSPFYFEDYVEDTSVTKEARAKADKGEKVECFLQLINNTFGIYIESQWSETSSIKCYPLFTPLNKNVDVADMIKELLPHIVAEGINVPKIKHGGVPIDKLEFLKLGDDRYRNVPLEIKKKVMIRSDFTYSGQKVQFRDEVPWEMEWGGLRLGVEDIHILLSEIDKREWEIEAAKEKEEREAREHQLLQFETKKEMDLL